MNAIEALRPVSCVFQLLGLSVVPFGKKIKIKIKNIPIGRIIKLLPITLRLICFLISIKNGFYHGADPHKIISAIEVTQIYSVYVLEMIILVEALVKAHQERQFMDNLLEIDRILMHHFNFDLKMNELKRSIINRFVIWITIIGFISARILLFHYNMQEFLYCFKYIISILTTSLIYYQIVTWTDLIRYRLHILNRLISNLNADQSDQIDTPSIGSAQAHSNFDTAYDAHTLDQFGIIYDLYNRFWIQTNLMNNRFKYSMVLHIGTDFVFLVSNIYFTFTCLI